MDERICLGVIAGAHGVRGLVRVKSFTEIADDIAAYGTLEDADGHRYALEIRGRTNQGLLLARVDGVADRTAAAALNGIRLHASRDILPPAGEDEYYHADLIGLTVERSCGEVLGTVTGLHNFGAGELIDIRLAGSGRSVMLPFDKATVPVVDVAGGRLVVDPMPGLLDDDVETGDAADGDRIGRSG